jgi:competence protein ComEC
MDPEAADNRSSRAKSRWPSYQPMALVVLAFIIGILLDRAFCLNWHWMLVGAWGSLCGWFLAWRNISSPDQDERRRIFSGQRIEFTGSSLLLVGLLCAAAFWHHGRWNWFGVNEIGRYASDLAVPCCVDVAVISEPRWSVVSHQDQIDEMEDSVRTRLTVRVLRIRDGKHWKAATGRTDLVIHAATSHVRSGDRVRVFGRLVASTPPSNPGQFNFRDFYRAKKKLAFLHAYEIESVQVLESASGWIGSGLLSSLRKRLNEMTWRYVAGDEAAFASAILLGNREQLSKSRRELFLQTGTVHLLAISGLHVGILAGSFFLLFRLGWVSRKKCLWATIAFVIFYAWLVEFRPPVSRAAILVTLFCVGRILGEHNFSFNLLAIAGLIVLLINPSDLFGIGPQLSFLAVASLTFGKDWVFWPPSRDPIKRLIASTRPWHVRTMNWLGRQLRTALLVSGLIWIVAMPLVAYRFHLVAPISLIVNPLLLLPIAWGLYGGLGVLVFGWFLSPAARMCGWICDRNLATIEWMIGAAQSVPGSHFWTAGPPGVSLYAFYLGLFLFAIYPPSRLPGRWIVGLGVCWILVGWVIPQQMTNFVIGGSNKPLICTFVDMGHGSGVLVQLPGGKNLLYDCGSFGASEYGARNLAGVMWSERIEHLDAVVLSHADVDHFNGLPELASKFSIDEVFVSSLMLESKSPAVTRLFGVLDQKEIPIQVVASGDCLTIDQTVAIQVLSPLATGAGGNDNSNSVVLLLEYAGSRILLPGDLEQAGMSRLMEAPPIDCDIVMAPHHGSRNSHPEQFMQWSKPEFVVISGGSQRVSGKMVATFAASGRTVARTDHDGAIRFEIRPTGIQMRCWQHDPWQ